jgi:hypothetical protein
MICAEGTPANVRGRSRPAEGNRPRGLGTTGGAGVYLVPEFPDSSSSIVSEMMECVVSMVDELLLMGFTEDAVELANCE